MSRQKVNGKIIALTLIIAIMLVFIAVYDKADKEYTYPPAKRIE